MSTATSEENAFYEDRDARDLLWNHFVIEMRQQLKLLESQGKICRPKLDEPLRNELLAATEGGYLSVWLHIEDGNGSWNQISPVDECQPWSLTPDGTAELSGIRMSVPELAQAFAAKLISK